MPRGFTLIELLVVITIIVVLLALLTPALDKAVYRAELARDAAQQKGIVTGVMAYAVEHRRHYPDRPQARNFDAARAIFLAPYDDRVALRPYMGIKSLVCPFTPGKVDLESPTTGAVYSGYNLWFGVQYPDNQGMFRLGDRWTWRDSRYNVLLSDSDEPCPGYFVAYASHRDMEGQMVADTYQEERLLGVLGPYTLSRWVFGGTHKRPPIDTHHAYEDGSVELFEAVAAEEYDRTLYPNGRMDGVPVYTSGRDADTQLMLVPRDRT